MKDNLDVEGQDLELHSFLRLVDPASDDPAYWARFRSWVLRSAGPELARRRLVADLTVGDVLTAWSRTLVPAAVLAAALAGLFVLRDAPGTRAAAPSMGVEELLVADVEDETIPVALDNDDNVPAVVFAAERF